MPFPKQQKHDFTNATLSTLHTDQSGIYGIFNHTCCIYIAMAEDIRESLLQHLNGQSSQFACISENDPQYWLASIVHKTLLSFWEKILLAKYSSVCVSQSTSKRVP